MRFYRPLRLPLLRITAVHLRYYVARLLECVLQSARPPNLLTIADMSSECISCTSQFLNSKSSSLRMHCQSAVGWRFRMLMRMLFTEASCGSGTAIAHKSI